MFLLRKPGQEQLRKFLDGQQLLDFTYTAVGASASAPPTGYVVDHTRTSSAQGKRSFARPRQPWNDGSNSGWAGWKPGPPTRRSSRARWSPWWPRSSASGV